MGERNSLKEHTPPTTRTGLMATLAAPQIGATSETKLLKHTKLFAALATEPPRIVNRVNIYKSLIKNTRNRNKNFCIVLGGFLYRKALIFQRGAHTVSLRFKEQVTAAQCPKWLGSRQHAPPKPRQKELQYSSYAQPDGALMHPLLS